MDIINGRLCKIKYCESCEIYRPPRTIHCSECGCCIERLDHHCPWIGTCIGKRNYKYFITFLWQLFFLISFCIIFSAVHFFDENLNSFNDEGIKRHSNRQIISVILLSITLLLSFFMFFLFGYHQYLLFLNETTNENIK